MIKLKIVLIIIIIIIIIINKKIYLKFEIKNNLFIINNNKL